LGLLLGSTRFYRIQNKFIKDTVIYPNDITLGFLNKILANQNLPPVSSFTIDDSKIDGGLTASVVRIKLNWDTTHISYANSVNLPASLIVKSVGKLYKSLVWSAYLNLPREAKFYELSGNNDVEEQGIHNLSFVPKTYYTYGSAFDGTYCIIMEDLSVHYSSGCKMLGNQCWGADPRFNLSAQDQFEMIKDIFVNVSHLHSTHWRDVNLFTKYPWLKNIEYLQGKNKENWVTGIETIKRIWKQTARPAIERLEKEGKLLHSSLFIDTMERYCQNSSWESYQEYYNISNPNIPFTICHGDFHAGNLMYKTSNQIDYNHLPKFYLFDWPEVCVFDPFFDISQFIISNATIELRRQFEQELFNSYYNELVKQIPSDQVEIYSREYCMTRYVMGVERWLQLFTLMAPSIPDFSIEFFHNQISTFIHDHSEILSQLKPTFITSYYLPSFVNE